MVLGYTTHIRNKPVSYNVDYLFVLLNTLVIGGVWSS